jgi:hypothetical protein
MGATVKLATGSDARCASQQISAVESKAGNTASIQALAHERPPLSVHLDGAGQNNLCRSDRRQKALTERESAICGTQAVPQSWRVPCLQKQYKRLSGCRGSSPFRGGILKGIEESDLVYLPVPACLDSQNNPHCVQRYININT